jgi:O-antigen ligase
MHVALAIVAFAYVFYSILRLNDRPGLFAGVSISSYSLSIYFGGIGAALGAIAILYGLSRLSDGGPLRRSEVFFLAWCGLCLLSVPLSPQIDVAATYGSSLIFLALSGYGLGRAVGRDVNFLSDMFVSSIVVVFLCEPSLLATRPANLARLSGDLNAVGGSLMADVPLVGSMAYLLLDRDLRGWRRLVLAGFFLLVVIPLALSFGTRGVVVAAIPASAALLAARAMQFRNLALVRDLLIGGLVIVAAGYAISALAPDALALLAPPRITNSLQGGGLDRSSLERLRFYGEAWDLILEAPLFGHGLGSFGYMANFAAGGYPHNAILEIAVNGGLVGLLLFTTGIIPPILSALSRALRQPANVDAWLLVALVVYTFTRLQLSLTITQGKLLFLLLGICTARFPQTTAKANTVEPLPGTRFKS